MRIGSDLFKTLKEEFNSDLIKFIKGLYDIFNDKQKEIKL